MVSLSVPRGVTLYRKPSVIIRTNMVMRVVSKNMQVVTFSSFSDRAARHTYPVIWRPVRANQTRKSSWLTWISVKGLLTSHVPSSEKKWPSWRARHDDEIIKHNEIVKTLDFIPAGPITFNPSELLLSEQLKWWLPNCVTVMTISLSTMCL